MKVSLALLGLMLGFSSYGEGRQEVKGFWASDGSIFSIFESDGILHGEIIALKEPLYTREEDAEREGQAKRDGENPDEILRQRPIIGLDMFSEYRFEKKRWQGKLYDPESGNTYQSRMVVAADGRLEIRGYIGVPLFGRTAQFDPVTSCQPHIVEMLKMTELAGVCEPGGNNK